MAILDKRTGKNGNMTLRARVRIQGQTRVTTFKRKTDAMKWAGKVEHDLSISACTYQNGS